MATNPLLRYGPPRAAGITCTLGVSGQFPDYVSGSAYNGTVSIGGAQGATRVELVPPGTDASGLAYVPLANADFAAAGASWAVVNELSAGTFTFQAGAGRTAAGFLRWAPTTGAPGSYLGDTIANTTLVQSSGGEVNLEAWVRCTAIGPQPGGEILDILLGVQIFEDAAGTIVRDPFSIGGSSSGSRRISGPIDWFPLRTRVNIPAGTYYRIAFQCRAGTSGTVEFDDCQWDARGVPSGPVSTLGLPAGFTIDTVTSPDRVRVQWPAIPTAGLAPYALLHFNGTNGSTSFPDDSGRSWTPTSTTISTAQSRFGGASGSFSVNSYLTGPADFVIPGTVDADSAEVCIEFWIRANAYPSSSRDSIAGTFISGQQFVLVDITPTGNILCQLGQTFSATSTNSIPLNTWTHVALARRKGTTQSTLEIFIAGASGGTIGYPNGSPASPASSFYIGSNVPFWGTSGAGDYFLDEFRITLGDAVYRAGFTPPTLPFVFPSGTGTSTLANLDFESGDVNWLKGAGWAITNVAPVDAGSWSAKYTGLGQSSLVHETMAPVTPGTSITASCRVSKGNNRKDFAGGAVLLEWLDANTRPLGFNVGNVINTGSSAFQTSTVTATAPAGAAFVRLGASGSRDVKGRASDAVTVDAFTWNHTFSLGGSGGSGGTVTPTTGPVALSFRVTDSVGCSAVATRTINQA